MSGHESTTALGVSHVLPIVFPALPQNFYSQDYADLGTKLQVSPPPPTPPSPEVSDPMPPQSSTLPGTQMSGNSNGIIIGVTIAVAFAVFIIFLSSWLLTKKRRRRSIPSSLEQPTPRIFHTELATRSTYISTPSYEETEQPYPPSKPLSLVSSITEFTYKELEKATNKFSEENLIGRGGFGCVYKGKIFGGQLVAVKQLNIMGGQGEQEFQAEVQTVSRVHHRHLVTLLGYCIMKRQRLLVYEYVPNFTLQYHLHVVGTPVMSWKIRQRIALGAAKGLAYLHEDCHPRIIHRDIKSANILIDNNFEAIVSDFGLAKLTSDEHTHVSTRVIGTLGYLAPEYASSGKVTEKSDVYSFGVVLLELITGQKAVYQSSNGHSLADWARPLINQVIEEKNLEFIVDPKLNYNYDAKEMMTMVRVAAACIRYEAKRRPTMGTVLRAFQEEALVFDLGETVIHEENSISTSTNTVGSIGYDSSQYTAYIHRFRTGPQVSQHHENSEQISQTGSQSIDHGTDSSLQSSDFQSSQELQRKPQKKPRKKSQ